MPFRNKCRIWKSLAPRHSDRRVTTFTPGAYLRLLDGGEEQITPIGLAAGVDVVQGPVCVELHGGQTRVGLGHDRSNVRHVNDGLAVKNSLSQVGEHFLPSVFTDADRAESEEEFAERHRAEHRIPGVPAFGDEIAFGQLVIFDLELADECRADAKGWDFSRGAECL